MLKASSVVLNNGTTFNGVTLIPSDDGFVVIEADGERVTQVMHHAVSHITYTDGPSMHYARGRAMAMYYEDTEKVRELLEEFGYQLEEMAEFIRESLEGETEGEEESKPKGVNPYE